jgi:hypothetical protein
MAPIMPLGDTPDDTAERVRGYSAKVDGLLLIDNKNHPLTKLVRQRWDVLHHLTGQDFLLVISQPPATWSDAFRDYWKAKLPIDVEIMASGARRRRV